MDFLNPRFGLWADPKKYKGNLYIREKLDAQPAIQIFKQRRPKKYAPILGQHGLWQCDLMFFPKYAHFNNGIQGILCFVEVRTRYALMYAFKTKATPEMLKLFNEYFDTRCG